MKLQKKNSQTKTFTKNFLCRSVLDHISISCPNDETI